MAVRSTPVSICAWSLPLPLAEAVRRLHALGFDRIDLEPPALDDGTALAAMSERGIAPHCIAADHAMPAGLGLTNPDAGVRSRTARHLRDVLDRWAGLGGRVAYVTPKGPGPGEPAAIVDLLASLAEHARACGLTLAVEPVPGGAFADCVEAAAAVAEIASPALKVLLDTGHCLLANEEPARAARELGPLLGYVHVDDNDGQSDLHWEPGTGRLKGSDLPDLVAACAEAGYAGAIAIELNAGLPDIEGAIARTRARLRGNGR